MCLPVVDRCKLPQAADKTTNILKKIHRHYEYTNILLNLGLNVGVFQYLFRTRHFIIPTYTLKHTIHTQDLGTPD